MGRAGKKSVAEIRRLSDFPGGPLGLAMAVNRPD